MTKRVEQRRFRPKHPSKPGVLGWQFAPKMGAWYYQLVRIIARSTLNGFVVNRVERKLRAGIKAHLDAWFAEAEKASWKNSAELKAHFRSASIVSAGRVVFNIKGNDYRLVVAINYHYQILLIIWLGTHFEYDEIDVARVTYEKERYADPSNSK